MTTTDPHSYMYYITRANDALAWAGNPDVISPVLLSTLKNPLALPHNKRITKAYNVAYKALKQTAAELVKDPRPRTAQASAEKLKKIIIDNALALHKSDVERARARLAGKVDAHAMKLMLDITHPVSGVQLRIGELDSQDLSTPAGRTNFLKLVEKELTNTRFGSLLSVADIHAEGPEAMERMRPLANSFKALAESVPAPK